MSRLVRAGFTLIDLALGFCFQPVCVGCGELYGASPLCVACRTAWRRVEPPLCDTCGSALTQPMSACGECLRLGNTRLRKIRSHFWLGENERTVLHKIKFASRYELLSLFRDSICDERAPFFPRDSVVVPVPLHFRRWRDRGFNQAEILARWIAKNHSLALCANGLAKRKATPAQSSLSRAERAKNLRVAFQWNEKIPCPRRALLIDDVFTTGATLRMCAKVLRRAGSEEIYGWTLFRVPS